MNHAIETQQLHYRAIGAPAVRGRRARGVRSPCPRGRKGNALRKKSAARRRPVPCP